MSVPRTLAVLAATAAVVAGCGSGSSSDPSTPGASSSGGTSSVKGLEVLPVYARYASGVPLGGSGGVRLGPQVPDALVGAMKAVSCPAPPSELQGMLLECDAGKTVYLLKAPIVAGGVQSATAKQIGHQKLWFVEVQFDPTGAAALAKAVTDSPGTELAFALPDRVLTAPVVSTSMADGSVGITGNYDRAQAQRLARQILPQ